MVMNYKKYFLMFLCIYLSGCSHLDRYMRTENSFFVKPTKTSDQVILQIEDEKDVHLLCLDHTGKPINGNKTDGGCLYFSADMVEIAKFFKIPSSESSDTDKIFSKNRNNYMSFLMSISDQNCETFLNRTFANKSTVDTTKNSFQDILTGASAGSALAAPSVAAGFSLTNLVVGKSIDNINSTFFFEKTFQAIGSAINFERATIKEHIVNSEKLSYQEYTIYDSLSDIRKYDSACSIRIGVSKLQTLAEEQLREKLQNKNLYNDLIETVSVKRKAEIAIAELNKKRASANENQRSAIDKAIVDQNNLKDAAVERIASIDEQAKKTAEADVATKTSQFTQAVIEAKASIDKTSISNSTNPPN